MYVTERVTSATQPGEQSTSYQGAIAQLGERLPCTQEVCGSIPHSSTITMMINGCCIKRLEKNVLED
jgi:hypothetical protein